MFNPVTSLQEIVSIFANFEKYVGYNINMGKSILFCLGDLNNAIPIPPNVKVPTEGFHYLGIETER